MITDQDGLDQMPMPANKPMGMEMRVPAQALAIDEDGGNVAVPEVGDAVNYRVDGKVTAVNGDEAVIAVEAINGVPTASAATTAQPGNELDSLRSDAESMGTVF